MGFDFDEKIDRRQTGSFKWDRYGGADVIPMWVADMDFRSPPAVIEALHDRIDHGVFGYASASEELAEKIVQRLKARYNWEIRTEWIVWLPGLVPALNAVCRAVGDSGDEVASFTPVYPPFLSAPANSGRELVTVGLQEAEGSYGIDIQAFEKTLTGKSKLLLFCNPHNPVGRVFGKEEIRQVAEICADRDMVICSDEIHCDLILDDKKHVPTASLSAEIAARTITLMSPSKTFNLAGLNFAFAIIPNTELRRNFIREVREKLPPVNALGLAAGLAAYRDCEQWRSELLDYLRGNRDLLEKFIKEETPGLSMNHVEATYLGWIDVRELNKEDPAKFFERVGVGLSDGKYFGAEGFLRINFGCPRSTLTEGLERIKRAVEDY